MWHSSACFLIFSSVRSEWGTCAWVVIETPRWPLNGRFAPHAPSAIAGGLSRTRFRVAVDAVPFRYCRGTACRSVGENRSGQTQRKTGPQKTTHCCCYLWNAAQRSLFPFMAQSSQFLHRHVKANSWHPGMRGYPTAGAAHKQNTQLCWFACATCVFRGVSKTAVTSFFQKHPHLGKHGEVTWNK